MTSARPGARRTATLLAVSCLLAALVLAATATASTTGSKLPNPTATTANPYVPTNMPALDDLWGAFSFKATPNNQPYTE